MCYPLWLVSLLRCQCSCPTMTVLVVQVSPTWTRMYICTRVHALKGGSSWSATILGGMC